MNINMCAYKLVALVSFIFIFNQQGHAQRPGNADLISVALHIVAEGSTQYFKEDNSGYFAMATLTNNQDTTISFWIMTCSWPDINWITNNDSVYFGSHGCDNNFPEKIELLPHKSIYFYGMFTPLAKKPLGKTLRLGFVYFSDFNAIYEAAADRSKIKKFKKYWSNEVVLQDNIFKYQTD